MHIFWSQNKQIMWYVVPVQSSPSVSISLETSPSLPQFLLLPLPFLIYVTNVNPDPPHTLPTTGSLEESSSRTLRLHTLRQPPPHQSPQPAMCSINLVVLRPPRG